MAKVFSSPIEIDQQDNVKSGAVNIIDEMKNMMEKSCTHIRKMRAPVIYYDDFMCYVLIVIIMNLD